MQENKLTKSGNINFSNRSKTEGLSDLVFGRTPPQAPELEEAVLGAMMLEKEAVSIALEILRPESFYIEAHQHICSAIIDLFNKTQPIDLLTVTEKLRAMGSLEAVGGYYYVAELTQRIVSTANVETHARIVSEKHIQRELIRVSTRIIQNAYDDTTDTFDLLDEAEKNLFFITDNLLSKKTELLSELLQRTINELETLKNKGEGLTGVPSGFTSLDRLTGGWQASDLIVIAARPGMGKTAFTLSMARNAAIDAGVSVAVFSLEMAADQLVKRLISAETEISGDQLRRGNIKDYEWIQITTKVKQLSEAPIYIDDSPAINIFDLRAKCRRLKSQYNIQLIVIDYLQLMSGVSTSKNFQSNREQEISKISRSLKAIAKELRIPVIALSQLNRSVETRSGDKRPQLSDLRESGAIEQDADLVLFIYRPEYYDKVPEDIGNDNAEIIVAKHRNGATGTVNLRFVKEFARFVDKDQNYSQKPGHILPLPSSMNKLRT